MMKLARSNLNLLLALDALLTEAHVSRAARRMGVTQSAMSHSLRQLRAWLGDPLLVRGRGGLVLTPRAERLASALRRGLSELERGLDEPVFELERSERRFVFAATDHLVLYSVPRLVETLHECAPKADLVVRPLEPARLVEQLEVGTLDGALAVAPPVAAGLRTRSLVVDGFVCVVRDGHPLIRRKPTVEQYARAQHVVHSPSGAGPSLIDERLAQRGLSRRVVLRLPSLLTAPLIVAQTDLVLTAPRAFVEAFAERLGLRSFAPPIDLGTFDVHWIWHERFDRDPANVWFREAVVAATRRGRRTE